MVNNRDISKAGISSTFLSFHLVTTFSSHLSCFFFQSPREEDIHPSLVRNRERGRGAAWNTQRALLDQLLQMGISQAWDKQTAQMLQPGWKSNANVPACVPLGNRQVILLPWVHAGADACSFEATAKALIDVSGARLSLCGCGSLKTKRGQSVNNSFDRSIDLRQYTHTHT